MKENITIRKDAKPVRYKDLNSSYLKFIFEKGFLLITIPCFDKILFNSLNFFKSKFFFDKFVNNIPNLLSEISSIASQGLPFVDDGPSMFYPGKSDTLVGGSMMIGKKSNGQTSSGHFSLKVSDSSGTTGTLNFKTGFFIWESIMFSITLYR